MPETQIFPGGERGGLLLMIWNHPKSTQNCVRTVDDLPKSKDNSKVVANF